MKVLFCLLITVPFLFSCSRQEDKLLYPEKAYPKLFTDVEMNRIFPDSKTFPDLKPNSPAKWIRFKYSVWSMFHDKDKLTNFVKDNFSYNDYSFPLHPDNNIGQHIASLWSHLIIPPEVQKQGTSLVPLPNSFIIPGGRFREVYYWDSYFTLLGLSLTEYSYMVQETVDNFAYLIDTFGFIPNGNRTYYLSRSQPPFFSYMVSLLAEMQGDSVYIIYLPYMEKEYDFWMDKNQIETKRKVNLQKGLYLNRYYDNLDQPRVEMYAEDKSMLEELKKSNKKIVDFCRNIRATAESGWDFSSRWFAIDSVFSSIETLGIIPVDLNCLLYHLETTISEGYRLKGDSSNYNKYLKLANTRSETIRRFLWNDSAGFYFDYNCTKRKTTNKYSLAGVFPLFIGLANKKEASMVYIAIRNRFLMPGGVVTTLKQSGQQWDYPNGWAPLQWITIKGLRNYGYDGLADTIKQRWLQVNKNIFNKHRKLLEKYNVVDTSMLPFGGEYQTQDGFGWTNGVYVKLMRE
jgi:alpha,alpha-trehalase